MKVMLCNDTGTKSHIGCRAVSDAHARMLGRLGHAVTHRFFVNEIRTDKADRFEAALAHVERNQVFMEALERVDAVIVNGEGTIHHGSGLALVAALHIAKRRGKATLLVNCLFQEIYFDPTLLTAFDYLSVRETRSADYIRSMNVRCIQTFDSIVAAKFDLSKSNVLTDHIVFTDWTSKSNEVAGKISTEAMSSMDKTIRRSLFPIHGKPGSLDNWTAAKGALACAKVVVSSRHHGLYLAALAKTPFIALPGRTWKSEALLETLGGALPIAVSAAALHTHLDHVDDYRDHFERAFQQLEEASELQHFSILGVSSDSSEPAEVRRLREDIEGRADLIAIDDANIAKRRRQEEKLQSISSRSPIITRLLNAIR